MVDNDMITGTITFEDGRNIIFTRDNPFDSPYPRVYGEAREDVPRKCHCNDCISGRPCRGGR